MLVYFNGLLLGLSLITALGPQNVFLIRQGALGRHAALSAFICFCCDIILITASITGLNELMTRHPSLLGAVTGFGVLFLLYYGIIALKNGLQRSNTLSEEDKEQTTRFQILMLSLGFSLLNPHAIIDSLIIIGGGSAQFPDHRYSFLAGALSASFLWFTSLTLATRYFAHILSRAAVWRCIETASGVLMLYLSVKLAMHLL